MTAPAKSAVWAGLAADDGVDSYFLAKAQSPHLTAKLENLARKFVPQHDRVRSDFHRPRALDDVDVAAADAASTDADQYFVVCRARLWDAGKFEPVRRINDKRFYGLPPPGSSATIAAAGQE
jgi:hypothetical protein